VIIGNIRNIYNYLITFKVKMNINDLGPVNFQASSEIVPYPRRRKLRQGTFKALASLGKCLEKWMSDRTFDLVQWPLTNAIFPASSKAFRGELDADRLEESRETMRKIGGVSQVLRTRDGALIESMFFSVNVFVGRIYELGGQFKIKKTCKGKYRQELHVYTSELKQIWDKFGVELNGKMDRGWSTTLTRPQAASPLISESAAGVTILTQGNASIFEFDRARIATTLLSGQHCMVFNIRGTGRSTGTPSERASYDDMEAVYQYLTGVRGFFNYHITAFGYCLGGGASTELAKNHPGVSLTMDRCFISMGDMFATLAGAQEQKTTRKLVKNSVDHLVFGYQNAEKLLKVTGAVCLVDAADDRVIPKDALTVLRQNVRSAKCTEIRMQGGHCDAWDDSAQLRYAQHLQTMGRLRDFGNTEMSQVAKNAVTRDLATLGPIGISKLPVVVCGKISRRLR
jgi:hypothetical protein